MVDSYLFEIDKCIQSKLKRSKATGLVNPVLMFIPWVTFRHILTSLVPWILRRDIFNS